MGEVVVRVADIMLIADDNRQLLNILKSAAQKEGFDTILALDGKEALDLFNAKQPQIVLLDVMMPQMESERNPMYL